MYTTSYVDYIIDMLSPLENVRVRKMFSGYGIYKDTVFFALILNNLLYFKVSNHNTSIYKSYGSEPFSYTKKNGKQVALSYWQVPVDIVENQSKLIIWAKRSLDDAKKAKLK